MNSTDYKIYDDKLRLVQRLYIPELAVWPVLQQHPMRTKNPDEAHLFVIGWSPVIAWNLQKRGQAIESRPKECAGIPQEVCSHSLHATRWDFSNPSSNDALICFVFDAGRLGS